MTEHPHDQAPETSTAPPAVVVPDKPGLEAEGHRDQAEGKAGEARDDVSSALRDASNATKFDNP